MNLKVLLNGEDITKSFDMNECNLYDRLGGFLDNVRILFPYKNGITFNKHDEISITVDKYSTGAMYITGCNGVEKNSKCLIKAVSCKATSRNRKSRIFTNITLHQLVSSIADELNLEVSLYDVVSYSYKSVCQMNETDLQFLNRICQREGYSVKISDGKLIVFNDFSLEHNYEPFKLKKEDVTASSFARAENGLRSMVVRHFLVDTGELISYSATDESFDGGSETVLEYLSTIDEAERFANGYLRAKNKNALTGVLTTQLNTDLSAGTLIELEDFEDYDGRYIIYEIRHDIVSKKSHFSIRKTLDY